MEDKKWYTLQEAMQIFKKELEINDTATIKKFIQSKNYPRLKAITYGEGKGKRYRIKDSWITQFIVDIEDC